MKQCKKCDLHKDESLFSKHRHGRGGLHPWCRECLSRYVNNRYHERKNGTFVKKTKTKKQINQSFDADLQVFYALARKYGLVVDHIVPLNGDLVSGLHVPWNLQLLTSGENVRKGKSVPLLYYKRGSLAGARPAFAQKGPFFVDFSGLLAQQ